MLTRIQGWKNTPTPLKLESVNAPIDNMTVQLMSFSHYPNATVYDQTPGDGHEKHIGDFTFVEL
jgi:hypothetical protein